MHDAPEALTRSLEEGSLDVLELIDKLDDLIHNARAVPLTDQVRIDREAIYDLLDQMRATIPEEVKQARWIVKERQEMLAEAKREAERLVADARDKAAQEASEQEVVKRAEREAADILEEARQREREVRLGAEDYADEVLGTLEVNLGKFLQAVQRGRERLQGRIDEGDSGEPLSPELAAVVAVAQEVAIVDLRALDLAPGAAARLRLTVPPVELRLGGQDYRTDPASPEVELEVTRALTGLALRLRTTVELVGPVHALHGAGAPAPGGGLVRVRRPTTRPPTTPRSTRTSTSVYVEDDQLDLGPLDAGLDRRARPGHHPVPRGLRGPVPDLRGQPQPGALRLRRGGRRLALGGAEGARRAPGEGARHGLMESLLDTSPCQAYFPFMKNDVRALRTGLNLTQGQLGQALGVSRQTINAIETERYTPSLPLAIALARLFGRPVEEVFHGDDDA